MFIISVIFLIISLLLSLSDDTERCTLCLRKNVVSNFCNNFIKC